MMFRHFLITRFNCQYFRGQEKRLNYGWLTERIKLFETYTFPSVRGQTEKNFEWILLCHSDTPREFKKRLRRYKGLSLVFTDATAKIIAPLIVKDHLQDEEFVITTRIDGDDAIEKDYIKCVQTEFREEVEFLNIPRGCLYDPRKELAFGRRSTKNPFISFVEKVGDLKTVYCTSHGITDRVAPVRQIWNDKARWLQVVHGGNVFNKVARKGKDKGFPLSRIARDFSLEIS
jgi:hypothetical protein